MNKCSKGIILAGGNGTRLYPLTTALSKQLMPVYDKPMIYYPLSTLMLAGIKDITIITTPRDNDAFKNLLGNGDEWGITLNYKIQKSPGGLAQAFLIAEEFIHESPVALILGDNLFAGTDLTRLLEKSRNNNKGATIFAYNVKDPGRYGVINFDKQKNIIDIVEKPKEFISPYAITGIYFFDETVTKKAKTIKPSKRGELEITDLIKLYLKEGKLNVEIFGRGMTWLDTGTFDSLHDASSFIKTIENRQSLKIGCPEEISWRKGWINDSQLKNLSIKYIKSGYGEYLSKLIETF